MALRGFAAFAPLIISDTFVLPPDPIIPSLPPELRDLGGDAIVIPTQVIIPQTKLAIPPPAPPPAPMIQPPAPTATPMPTGTTNPPNVIRTGFLSRLGGIVIGGITGGLPGAIVGGITDPLGGGSQVPGETATFAGPPPTSASPCPGLFNVRINGVCVDPTKALPGGAPVLSPVGGGVVAQGPSGTLVEGRFGIGVLPVSVSSTTRRCPAGMALGKDGICYDGLARNSKNRQWPMGRRPLLGPGELAAISKAKTAANRVIRTQKNLKKIGRIFDKI